MMPYLKVRKIHKKTKKLSQKTMKKANVDFQFKLEKIGCSMII